MKKSKISHLARTAGWASLEREILGRLEVELNPALSYHNVRHTRDDVLPATRRLAEMEDVKGENFHLLLTAALLHDMGYLERYHENEAIGARMARDILPRYGYSETGIRRVARIILATQLAMKPKTLLQAIIRDADTDSLGRDDFFILSCHLYQEHLFFVADVSPAEWLRRQQVFMETHVYFTKAARTLRDEGKRRNLEKLLLLRFDIFHEEPS